jgi:hypothetical protein
VTDYQAQQLLDHLHLGKVLEVRLQPENETIVTTTQGKYLIWKCDANIWHVIRDKELVPKYVPNVERILRPNFQNELTLESSWIHFQHDYYAVFEIKE